MRDQEILGLWGSYLQVWENQQLDEALTGERLQKAKEIIARDPKSPKDKAVKRVADSQEGSDRGDTKPGDLPQDRRNTTLPTGRGGRGRKGLGKTTNRPGGGGGYPLGGRTSESDRGRGNRASRRAGGDVEDTRYDESFDLYDTILEHLIAEGYADTNEAALAIMVNMSEEWRESIVEAAKDQSDKQIEKGVKTTYKAQNVLDNLHQGRSRGISRLPAGEKSDKVKRMRGRLKARRDDLFGERNKREDESRAEIKRKYGI